MKEWMEGGLDKTDAPPKPAKLPDRFTRWTDREIEYIAAVPRWLVGSLLIGSFALGMWWGFTDSWVTELGTYLQKRYRDIVVLLGVFSTMIPTIVLLAVIGRRFPPKTNVPSARLHT